MNIRLDSSEYEKLKVVADLQKTTQSALARLFIYEGVNRFDARSRQIQEKLDFLIELITADKHLSAGAVAAAALLNSKGLERKHGETVEEYRAKFFADLKENIRSAKVLGVQIQKAFVQDDY